ncbi:MAG TPA: RIP metalloprotease RseP [Candidatus Binatus sp.]|uniref:RIP metalloprotease RseP n=1 Tax=Candidatus Binatus sp. TaxID=2811406 RepID=UPI002B463C3F|nr:RIP metalloprotease RseP [Candidatus Binatus sp.]HKN13767.1 RIP metalloprotease RseP [Candidatus Binatus sp.]
MIHSILSAALVFAVLVVVHEAGHFAMAKKVGVRVLRFSIGYPPKLFGFRRGETDYSIGATPFGGYVRMLGDEVGEKPTPEEIALYLHEVGLDLIGAAREHGAAPTGAGFDDNLHALAERLSESAAGVAHSVIGRELKPDEALLLNEARGQAKVGDIIKSLSEHPPTLLVEAYCKRAFPTQSLGKRVLIVLAGPMANIVFAPLLLTFVFMYGVPQLLPVVGKTTKDLPAAKAGLQAGDRILAVNGQPMETWADFSKTVKAGDGSPITLEIDRPHGARSTIVIKPTRLEQKTLYGTNATTWVIGVQPSGDEVTKRYGPIGAVKEAGETSVEMTVQMVVGIASIFTGSTPVKDALGGPIMIAQMAGQEAHRGLANLAMFTVMLSLELGVINLLPVPLLDGGHLLFFVFEGVKGKPLELRYREAMLQVGLFLLVALMAFVIFNDISRIVQG